MPRQPRTSSGTGIYHVMLRGINRQDIFEEQEDYQQFLIRLQNLVDPIDDNGEHIPSYFHVGDRNLSLVTPSIYLALQRPSSGLYAQSSGYVYEYLQKELKSKAPCELFRTVPL